MKVDTCKVCGRAFWSTNTDNGVCHGCNLKKSIVEESVKPKNWWTPKTKKSETIQREEDGGHIYLLKSENGFYKIGKAKHVKSRLLSWQRTFPIKIELVYSIACHNRRDVENFLHQKYWKKRAEREWYKLDAEDVAWITSLRDYELG